MIRSHVLYPLSYECGGHPGSRTQTERGLGPLPLPVGLDDQSAAEGNRTLLYPARQAGVITR